MTTLVWFRQDLRLADHPALHAVLRAPTDKGLIIPVYIHTAETLESGMGTGHGLPEGGAARWWRHHSLKALSKSLETRGSRLVIRRGDPLTGLWQLIRETGATRVVWHRRMEPAAREEDSRIKATLRAEGIEVHSFNGNYLHEPWEIMNKQGKPFQVFTPYWKAVIAAGLDLPSLPAPDALPGVPDTLDGLSVEALGLLPEISWDRDFYTQWQPGETGAWKRFEDFLPLIDDYAEARNLLIGTGVSKLSAHLHFGEISPRQIVRHLLDTRGSVLEPRGVEHFVRELGWREFGAYLAFHFPETVDSPLDKRFLHFAWRVAPEDLRAWQRGQTGVPVVDAAMRCLWHTGWMHNRARMIVASFLTKNLLIDWRHGAAWFMDTLVDADEPSNTAGWQWTAGTGADAAPYFRIFNPVLQAEKFDPDGAFIRRWVPELARLDNRYLYAPWTADTNTLHQAGITLGKTYPAPIVDLQGSRQRALEHFNEIKRAP
ncbi:MAG: deoxyribodipyrimidine photo-lyase [Halothiobacillus sp.]